MLANRHPLISTLVAVAITGMAPMSLAHAGTIRYVDDDAPVGGDGLSWATAYRFLQDAIAAASPGSGVTEIRLAGGLHKPDQGAGQTDDDRFASFELLPDVAIRGGYAGVGAPDPDARDIHVHVTTLSGDLLGDDTDPFHQRFDNAHHVVTALAATPATVLDGVTIYGGYAWDGPIDWGGGAMVHYATSLTFLDCTFDRNAAWFGGGAAYARFASPVFDGCHFIDNRQVGCGGAFGGGGVFGWQSPVIIRNCTFLENWAEGCIANRAGGGIRLLDCEGAVIENCSFTGNIGRRGGGVYAEGGSLTVSDCTFVDNFASVAGHAGGLSLVGGSATVANCYFTGNRTVLGDAGALKMIGTSAIVTQCVFDDNEATNYGGAASLRDSTVTLMECTFSNNRALQGGGGALSILGGTVYLVNCLLTDNTAGSQGGAIDTYAGIVTLVNCTIARNEASEVGGLFAHNKGISVSNSILWGNTDDLGTGQSSQLFVPGGSVAFSCIQGLEAGSGGLGNIADDPLFIDEAGGDLRLSSGSPCIDAADSAAVPPEITTDLDGNPRFVDDPDTEDTGNGDAPIVDMGAYEFQLPCPSDLNGDGTVNVLDLIQLVMSFGPCEGCPADFDDDGFVNVLDLIALIMNFGPCPGTECVWDVNGDGIVDQSDVQAVTSNLGPCEDPENCPWDVNGDGVVNGSDVQAVATHFGPCP